MSETSTAEEICAYGRSLFERGLTFGSSGNISIRTGDGFLTTPTGVALDKLDPARLARGFRAKIRPKKHSCTLPCMPSGARPGPLAGTLIHLSGYGLGMSVQGALIAAAVTLYVAIAIGTARDTKSHAHGAGSV